MVMFKEKLFKDFKEKCGRSTFLEDRGKHCMWTKKRKSENEKMCDDAFRWSMPNTPAGQPEMLCTTVNIGGRWLDEHFRLNLFQYSPISFSSASHFEIFWWTLSDFTFLKSKFFCPCFQMFEAGIILGCFSFLFSCIHGRAREPFVTLGYSVGRSSATVFFL